MSSLSSQHTPSPRHWVPLPSPGPPRCATAAALVLVSLYGPLHTRPPTATCPPRGHPQSSWPAGSRAVPWVGQGALGTRHIYGPRASGQAMPILACAWTLSLPMWQLPPVVWTVPAPCWSSQGCGSRWRGSCRAGPQAGHRHPPLLGQEWHMGRETRPKPAPCRGEPACERGSVAPWAGEGAVQSLDSWR